MQPVRHSFAFLSARCMVVALMAVCAAESAAAEDVQALARQQQTQDAARGLTTALVADVLDVQLRQLEENGLTNLPMYADVKAMRANLAQVTAGPMQAITRLLAEAQQAPPGERPAMLAAARAQVREVVSQLIAERQRLYRRMQVARLTEQTRELMALQTKVHHSTQALPLQAAQDRDQLALKVIEDQADVQKLYLQLVAALNDVSGWGGQASTGAIEGLRLLRAAQVETDLHAAEKSLRQSDYSGALSSQQSALKGLAALADRLSQAQGLSDADRETALRMVKEVRHRQELLRQETLAPNLASHILQAIVEKQTVLHQDLGRLAKVLVKFPATGPLLEQAKLASFEATASLFESQAAPAGEAQAQVIASLTQIESLLQNTSGAEQDLSADELAELVARLEALAQQLASAENKQLAVLSADTDQAQTAANRQAEVESALQEAMKGGDWSSVIQARLDAALEKVAASAKAMSDEAASEEAQRSQADQAYTALKLAAAEVQVQLADARRRHKAVEVGELARAAEALERASSAERVLARHLKVLAAEGRLTPQQLAILLMESADVSAVAERVAAGLENTAPPVSALLARMKSDLEAVTSAIDATQTDPAPFVIARLQATSASADEAGKKLASAAAALRTVQRESAGDLAEIAKTQLAAAASVREAIDQVAQAADESNPAALQQLIDARKKRVEALVNEARSDGRAEHANRLVLAQAISELADAQRYADRLADDWTSGQTSDALEAASAQQAVADGLQNQLKNAAPQAAPLLERAAAAAAEAARQSLTGNPVQAAKERAQVREHLAQAQQSIRSGASQSADESLDELDRSIESVAQAQSSRLREYAHALRELRDRSATVDASSAAALDQARRKAEQEAPAAMLPAVRDEMLQRLDQAAGNLAAREQQLRQHHELAGILRDLAAEQQRARETIAKAVEDLGKVREETATDRIAAAQTLLQAQQQFAAAQTAIGEGAAQVSGQEQVANVPIREGLEIASRLHRSLDPQADGQGERASDQPKADGPSPNQGQGKPGEGKNAQGQAKEGQLGTKLVPASPNVTAQQIAGPEANAAAATAMEAAMQAQGQPGQGQGKSDNSQQGETSSTAKKGGASKGGKTAENQRAEAGELETASTTESDSRAGQAGADATAVATGLEGEPWFSKLPPQLRSAIQAKARSQAPRGYEERLRRYFQSVD